MLRICLNSWVTFKGGDDPRVLDAVSDKVNIESHRT